jgi:hypothetical protein
MNNNQHYDDLEMEQYGLLIEIDDGEEVPYVRPHIPQINFDVLRIDLEEDENLNVEGLCYVCHKVGINLLNCQTCNSAFTLCLNCLDADLENNDWHSHSNECVNCKQNLPIYMRRSGPMELRKLYNKIIEYNCVKLIEITLRARNDNIIRELRVVNFERPLNNEPINVNPLNNEPVILIDNGVLLRNGPRHVIIEDEIEDNKNEENKEDDVHEPAIPIDYGDLDGLIDVDFNDNDNINVIIDIPEDNNIEDEEEDHNGEEFYQQFPVRNNDPPNVFVNPEDSLFSHNVYNAENRNLEVRCNKYKIIEVRREGFWDFVTCSRPDFLEEFKEPDVTKHMFMVETDYEVWLPARLPEEVAMKWIATRDENNTDHNIVVASIVENYCRQINCQPRILADAKHYIPLIACKMTKTIDMKTQPKTVYTSDRRHLSAITARMRIVYAMLLPLISLLLVMFSNDLTNQIKMLFHDMNLKLRIPNLITDLIIGVVLGPILAEFIKRANIVYDGAIKIVLKNNFWINLWYSTVITYYISYAIHYNAILICIFIFQLTLGSIPYARAVIIHIIVNLFVLTPIWTLIADWLRL